jgi:hypothetical protein
MRLAAFLTATMLAFAPVATFAECYGKSEAAASCAPGYVWSHSQGACVATSS